MNDKLGYYTCNGIKFTSKIRGAIYAQATGKQLEWHFNEEEFNNFPWHIEPEFTLDQLYDLRAKTLREEYDYLILCYSGGSDSNQIVESFIRQNIFLDEIVSNFPLSASEKFLSTDRSQTDSWNLFGEFKLNTAEKLDYIKNNCPGTKISVFDTSDLLMSSFITSEDTDWVLTKKETLNPSGSTQFNYTHFKEIRTKFDLGKKIGIIVGVDKPRLVIKDKKLYLYFVDKAANIIPIEENFTDYPNAKPVLFYWDPDSSVLLAKQAHVMLNWLNKNPQLQKYWETTDWKFGREINEKLMKTILYPTTWDNRSFQVVKPAGDWFCELDAWFINGYKGHRAHNIWKDGLDYISKKIPSYLRLDALGNPDGTLAIHSPRYYIGDIT